MPIATLKKEHRTKSAPELAILISRIALEQKAEELVVLDLRGLSSFTDYFVIMNGRSTRHVQGLAQIIEEQLGSKRISSKNSEGLKEGRWVLLDFGDVVVHIFYHDDRGFYNLEGLWHEAKRLSDEDLGISRI